MNAFFTCSIFIDSGNIWQNALEGVFIVGVFFTMLSLTKLRYILIVAIPPSLKHAITSGISLFIAFISLKNGKFPCVKGGLFADAVGAMADALLGTSQTSAYVKSGTGVAASGRTSLA